MQTMEQTIEEGNTPPNGANQPHHTEANSAWVATAKLLALGALIIGVLASRTGMLTTHMAGHIVVMNIAAPAVAWMLRRAHSRCTPITIQLFFATGLQLVVFFLWHSPPAMAAAMSSPILGFAMLAGLFAVSLWFWVCVFEAVKQDRMEVIAALLITGKLVCLIAVLLVFAPRLIYPGMAMESAGMGDQQLAGLLMLSACPLTYVGASICVVARWFSHLSSSPVNGGRRE